MLVPFIQIFVRSKLQEYGDKLFCRSVRCCSRIIKLMNYITRQVEYRERMKRDGEGMEYLLFITSEAFRLHDAYSCRNR
jgi:hypothetical protein